MCKYIYTPLIGKSTMDTFSLGARLHFIPFTKKWANQSLHRIKEQTNPSIKNLLISTIKN